MEVRSANNILPACELLAFDSTCTRVDTVRSCKPNNMPGKRGSFTVLASPGEMVRQICIRVLVDKAFIDFSLLRGASTTKMLTMGECKHPILISACEVLFGPPSTCKSMSAPFAV